LLKKYIKCNIWKVAVLPSYIQVARTQHDCHHDMKVKTQAATAVIELLMMGGKTPENIEL
jgi:hypothetical protein